MFEIYRPFLKQVVFIFLLLVTGQILFLTLPYLSGKIIDQLAEQAPVQDFYVLVGGILCVYLISGLFNYLRERHEFLYLDFELPRHLQIETLEKLFLFSLGQHVNENSGLRQSVISRGVSALQELMKLVTYSFVPFILQIILATGAIFFLNPLLGLTILVTSILYFGFIVYYNFNFYPHLTENRDRWNKQHKQYSEILRNVKLVKVTAKENTLIDFYCANYKKDGDAAAKMWVSYIGAYYSQGIIVSVGQIVTLGIGIWLVSHGIESPGKIVMLIGWMGSVFGNIGNLGWIQRQMLFQIADINK